MCEVEESVAYGKILTCNNIKAPVEGRCGYFVKRKQRYCKMLPGKGNKFCAEHLCEDKEMNEREKRKRINCPLDPKHTIFEDNLVKHLKKCNATLKTKLPYYTENINLLRKTYILSEQEKMPLHLVPVEELKELIIKIRNTYNISCTGVTSQNASMHPVLDDELNKSGIGPSVKKHLIQQASLVNILQQSGALEDNRIIIEFGAGRGALSHWVQKAMNEKRNTKFLLVDRQHNRNKLDCYHRGEEQGPDFERLNIDIQHLNLGDVCSITDNDLDLTAIGKHLCGGATDLSLKCLMEAHRGVGSTEDSSKKQKQELLSTRLHSMLFALCCYHRCTWSTYVGNHFIENSGFSALQFARMAKMATWSTCGFERRLENTNGEDKVVDDEDHAVDGEEKLHVGLGLTSDEQAAIGRMCKGLLDEGRMQYIRSYGYQCELIKYVNDDVTPENISLLVQRCVNT